MCFRKRVLRSNFQKRSKFESSTVLVSCQKIMKFADTSHGFFVSHWGTHTKIAYCGTRILLIQDIADHTGILMSTSCRESFGWLHIHKINELKTGIIHSVEYIIVSVDTVLCKALRSWRILKMLPLSAFISKVKELNVGNEMTNLYDVSILQIQCQSWKNWQEFIFSILISRLCACLLLLRLESFVFQFIKSMNFANHFHKILKSLASGEAAWKLENRLRCNVSANPQEDFILLDCLTYNYMKKRTK